MRPYAPRYARLQGCIDIAVQNGFYSALDCSRANSRDSSYAPGHESEASDRAEAGGLAKRCRPRALCSCAIVARAAGSRT